MSRFIRLKLCNNGWEEHEESFSHMNRDLKFILGFWDVLEETLQSAGLLHCQYRHNIYFHEEVHEIIVKIFVLPMKRVQDNTLEYCILLYN